MAALFVNGLGRNEQSLHRTFHRCFLPSFGSFGQAVSGEKILKNPQYLYRDNCILNTDTLYLYLNKSYLSFNRGEDFLEINQSETRLSCGGHVCDGSRRNEHLYRGPSIDASYQVYVYLVKWFQKKRFF